MYIKLHLVTTVVLLIQSRNALYIEMMVMQYMYVSFINIWCAYICLYRQDRRNFASKKK